MYHAWQNADSNLRRMKQSHESNRAQGRLGPDQLSRSLALVGEAERRALEAKQEFEQTSRLVKTEVARFEQERIEDFKTSLEAYLEGMITRQKQVRLSLLSSTTLEILTMNFITAHRVLGELSAIAAQAIRATGAVTTSARFSHRCRVIASTLPSL